MKKRLPESFRHRVAGAGIENKRIVFIECECGHLVLKEKGYDENLTMLLCNAQSDYLDHQRESISG